MATRTEVPYPDSYDPQFTNIDTEILRRHFAEALERRANLNEIIPRMDAELDYRRAIEAGECPIFVSPTTWTSFSTDKCVECGTRWDQHKNIGPGWRERSERRKVELQRFEEGMPW